MPPGAMPPWGQRPRGPMSAPARAAAMLVTSVALMLADGAALGAVDAAAAAAVLALLLFGSAVLLRPWWAFPLPAAAWGVAWVFLVPAIPGPRPAGFGGTLLLFAVAITVLGGLAGHVGIGRLAVAVLLAVRERWRRARDPERCPSTRPFNQDERLWERELSRR